MSALDGAVIRAVVFDFNGTLFRDERYHERAWEIMGERYGRRIAPNEIERCVIGFSNREILSCLFGAHIDDCALHRMSEEKEKLYRELCSAERSRCALAPGAEEFLEYLKKIKIPVTIATSSIKENVDYFFDLFHLERWFDRSRTVWDDEIVRCKPFPDMYLAAARHLGVVPSQAMAIEDSRGGIEAAKRASMGCIIAIGPVESHVKFKELSGIHSTVSDFSEIDRRLFGAP